MAQAGHSERARAGQEAARSRGRLGIQPCVALDRTAGSGIVAAAEAFAASAITLGAYSPGLALLQSPGTALV